LDQVVKRLILIRLALSDASYILSLDSEVTTDKLAQIESDVTRLLANEPLQYILGETYFYGLTIYCTSATLIPRPETEELVDWVLKDHSHEALKVMDLGTGSGCIPLAIKSMRSNWTVYGIDVSREALSIANANAKRLGLEVDFKEVDLLIEAGWPKALGLLDVLISNPPYIPVHEKHLMKDNVVNYEPHVALFVPSHDPLLFYERIVAFSLLYLKEGGWLYLEIHEGYSQETMKLLKEAGFANIKLRKDLQGKPRMVKAQRVSLSCES
jgi:release factor glutamine methyltransferase